jgi:hypothetical protein
VPIVFGKGHAVYVLSPQQGEGRGIGTGWGWNKSVEPRSEAKAPPLGSPD